MHLKLWDLYLETGAESSIWLSCFWFMCEVLIKLTIVPSPPKVFLYYVLMHLTLLKKESSKLLMAHPFDGLAVFFFDCVLTFYRLAFLELKFEW